MKILINHHKKIIALLLTFTTSFIAIGTRTDGMYTYYGFPADWLGYHGGGQYSFQILGLILNYFIFYLLVILIIKLMITLKKGIYLKIKEISRNK